MNTLRYLDIGLSNNCLVFSVNLLNVYVYILLTISTFLINIMFMGNNDNTNEEDFRFWDNIENIQKWHLYGFKVTLRCQNDFLGSNG